MSQRSTLDNAKLSLNNLWWINIFLWPKAREQECGPLVHPNYITGDRYNFCEVTYVIWARMLHISFEQECGPMVHPNYNTVDCYNVCEVSYLIWSCKLFCVHVTTHCVWINIIIIRNNDDWKIAPESLTLCMPGRGLLVANALF